MSHKKHLTVDEALDQIESGHESSSKAKVDLPTLWEKVRPFVTMLSAILGKKVGVYINAFVAAIDSIVDQSNATE